MSIDSIANIASVSSSPSAAQSLQANGMGMQDLLKVLLTQLTYQDPMKPMDSQQFMTQMMQTTLVQQGQDGNAKLDALIASQATLLSVGLLGKRVDVTLDSGPASGTVVALALDSGTPRLTISTQSGASLSGITPSQITLIR
jgi:flagellar basal-body rod modification protein FlgD